MASGTAVNAAEYVVFSDDFNRADSSTVGNGWLNTPNAINGTMLLNNNEVTLPTTNFTVPMGMYRPFPFNAPVRIQVTLREGSGHISVPEGQRYDPLITILNEGTTTSGYGIAIAQTDSAILNPSVYLFDNGYLANGDGSPVRILSPIIYGTELAVDFTIYQDGSIVGSITDTDTGGVFNFNFPPRQILSNGSNFMHMDLATTNNRIKPRFDDLILSTLYTPVSCTGFQSPMANGPVTVKKNRALPMKAELYDPDGYSMTATDITALPVVQVTFSSAAGGDPIDVTADALSAGEGSEGNQFEFNEDGILQFNLKTKNYDAPGTYTITMVSGDAAEYIIYPTCSASFVIE